jgi:periplasmic protein TonB
MVRSLSTKCMIAVAAISAFSAPVFAQSADWQKQVARLIASKQTYPRAAQMRGDEGTVKVKVYVSASGAIEKTEMVAPSGSSVLDREALALPAKAGTFPAPPGGATSVVLPLTWKLM